MIFKWLGSGIASMMSVLWTACKGRARNIDDGTSAFLFHCTNDTSWTKGSIARMKSEEWIEETDMIIKPSVVLRKLFLCWWGGCGGEIMIVRGKTVFWQCQHCGKVVD